MCRSSPSHGRGAAVRLTPKTFNATVSAEAKGGDLHGEGVFNGEICIVVVGEKKEVKGIIEYKKGNK